MWVPKGDDWYGINDRHLVCNSTYILEALDVLRPFLFDYDHDEKAYKGIINPEGLLKAALARKGLPVRRSEWLMFKCEAPGDQTSMDRIERKGVHRMLPEGVRLKKIFEYEPSLATCASNHINRLDSTYQ